MRGRVNLEIRKDRGMRRKIIICEIFPLQMEFDGLLKIGDQLVEGFALRDDRQFDAFGDVVLTAFVHMDLDNPLHD